MKIKSKWLVLIALLLAATMLFAACGGSAETPADNNENGNGTGSESGSGNGGNSSGDNGGNGGGGNSDTAYSTGFTPDAVYDDVTGTSGAAIADARGCTDVDVLVPPTRTTYFGDVQPYLWDTQNGFRAMPNAKTVTIPEGFLEIRVGFGFSNSLEKITLPTTIRKLCTGVMQNCPALTTVVYKGTTAQWEAIEKEAGWIGEAASVTIVCSDGNIG